MRVQHRPGRGLGQGLGGDKKAIHVTEVTEVEKPWK